jgi:hypothetical protein
MMKSKIVFYLFCLMLFMLPLSAGGFEFEIGVVTFHPYTFMVVAMLPLVLWRIIWHPAKFGFRTQDAMILLLAASYFSSTLLADDVMQSGRLAFHSLFIPIVTYLICKALISSEKEYQLALKILLVAICLFGLVTIYEFLKTFVRPYVLDIPPIGVATLLIVPVIYSIYVKGYGKVWRFIQMIVTGTALVLTMSRIYLAGAIASPILRRLLRSSVVWVWGGMLAGTLLITLSVTYLVKVDYSALRRSTEGQQTMERIYEISHIERALAGRILVYRDALKKFEKNLVFGTGLEAGEYQITTHNFHVEWLQYGGLIGYLLYVLVFMTHAVAMRRHIINDSYLLANNLLLLLIMLNSVTNGFMHGIMPYVAYLLMGLSEARINILGGKQ